MAQGPQPSGWESPQTSTGWGVPGSASRYGTSGWAILAALPLVAWGLLWTLVGAVGFAMGNIGQIMRGIPNEGEIGGIFALFPLLIVAIGVLQILAGIFIWAHRSWARYLGLVLAALGTAFGVVLLAGALGPGRAQPFALEISLVVLVPYAIALVGLIVGAAQFRRVQ